MCVCVLFLCCRGGSNRVLALTAAHVARPLPVHLDNWGLTEKASSRHREEIIIQGEQGFEDAVNKIESRIGTLHSIIVSAQGHIQWLEQQKALGTGDPDRIASALRCEREKVTILTDDIEQLDLHRQEDMHHQ